jgi:hypothetical protein
VTSEASRKLTSLPSRFPQVRTIQALDCQVEGCVHGQFYPPVCTPDAATRLTDCGEVLLEAPQYHRGYFEGLLATHGLHLTGVYLGTAMDALLADLQSRRLPAVFYGYHPSEVYGKYSASRIVFPQRVGGGARPAVDTALLMDDDTAPFFDYPVQPLQKLMCSAMADDPWLAPALTLLRALSVSDATISSLLTLASASSPVDPHAAVCSFLAQPGNSAVVDKLRAMAPPPPDLLQQRMRMASWVQVVLLIVGPLGYTLIAVIISQGEEEASASAAASQKTVAARAGRLVTSPVTVAAATLGCWAALLGTFRTHNTGWVERVFEPLLYVVCVVLAAYLIHAVALAMLRRVQRRLNSATAQSNASHGKTATYVSKALVPFARSIVGAVVFIALLVVLLQRFGEGTTSVLVTSAMGFTIALACSETLKDWFAGAIVLTDSQYRAGDWVIIHGSKRIEGIVEEVSLRVTRVRGFKGRRQTLQPPMEGTLLQKSTAAQRGNTAS